MKSISIPSTTSMRPAYRSRAATTSLPVGLQLAWIHGPLGSEGKGRVAGNAEAGQAAGDRSLYHLVDGGIAVTVVVVGVETRMKRGDGCHFVWLHRRAFESPVSSFRLRARGQTDGLTGLVRYGAPRCTIESRATTGSGAAR